MSLPLLCTVHCRRLLYVFYAGCITCRKGRFGYQYDRDAFPGSRVRHSRKIATLFILASQGFGRYNFSIVHKLLFLTLFLTLTGDCSCSNSCFVNVWSVAFDADWWNYIRILRSVCILLAHFYVSASADSYPEIWHCLGTYCLIWFFIVILLELSY